MEIRSDVKSNKGSEYVNQHNITSHTSHEHEALYKSF